MGHGQVRVEERDALNFYLFELKKDAFVWLYRTAPGLIDPTCISFHEFPFKYEIYIRTHTYTYCSCWGVGLGRRKIEGFKARPLRLELSPSARISNRQSIYNKA